MSISLLRDPDFDGGEGENPSTQKVNEMITALNLLEGAGESGGVPTQLLTHWNRVYDNRTSGPGEETTLEIYSFAMVAGLIRIEESGMQIQTVGFRVTTAATDEEARMSIYTMSDSSGAGRGLLGDLVLDCGVVSVGTTGYKSRNVFTAVDPGFYWVTIEPSDTITIAGFQSHSGQLGSNTSTGAVNSGVSTNIAGNPLDPSPASLDAGNIIAVAPLVYFDLDEA